MAEHGVRQFCGKNLSTSSAGMLQRLNSKQYNMFKMSCGKTANKMNFNFPRLTQIEIENCCNKFFAASTISHLHHLIFPHFCAAYLVVRCKCALTYRDAWWFSLARSRKRQVSAHIEAIGFLFLLNFLFLN